MKKTLLTLVALLLAVAMCFAFVGCSKDDDKEDEKDDNKTSVSDKADKDDKDTEDKEDKEDKEDEEDEEEEEDDKKPTADKDDAEAVAENYVESVLVDFDAEQAFKDIHDDVMAAITDDVDGFIEEFQGYLDILADAGIEYEYDFVGEGDTDLETMQDNYADIDLEVEDCAIFEVEIIGLGEEDVAETYNISVVLIDGEWYLDPIETNL